jgi:hypothetical protein
VIGNGRSNSEGSETVGGASGKSGSAESVQTTDSRITTKDRKAMMTIRRRKGRCILPPIGFASN